MYRSTTPTSVTLNTQTTTRSNSTLSSQPPPFWFGGAASCVATFVSHPFDLTKVRIQTQVRKQQPTNWDWRLLRPSNMIRTMRSIVHSEGIKALYTGLDASLLRQGTYSTIRFGLYDHFKWLIAGNDKPTFQQLLLCSTAAGVLGGAFGNPSDVVNVRMQGDGQLPPDKQRHYKNAIDGMYRICRDEGPRVLLRGLGTSTQRAVLITVSQMTSYDEFKIGLVNTLGWYDGMMTHFTASLLAGLVATTVCSPLDVVKTRIMSAHVHDGKHPIQIMLQMIKMEGFGSLFRGWMPAFIRLGPHTVVTFLVLEKLKEQYAHIVNSRLEQEH
ncbi:mitochondrial carrier domain-containing protein [Halteromyces radiatus]|uniref:mitochondrial carrier domain-containing protein n=1 Tax=Halteromyces radiatus TaxID=101107 RepID=UPI00221EE5B6|nr:mitochondrial carrier domain-containing protein [Halteromyces radiatus]KAI8099199.1 mitochondrial carrier domain-containing protein [Halteromyces radiatus]